VRVAICMLKSQADEAILTPETRAATTNTSTIGNSRTYCILVWDKTTLLGLKNEA
jgi:hypothetical protein